MKVVFNFFDLQGDGAKCILARSPSEVSMVTPSELFLGTCSEGGVGDVGIMPGMFACVMHWCVRGAIRI